MAGRVDARQATEGALRGGWFHSGELGVTYPDDDVELRDRLKDIIISRGENISKIEVGAIVARPGVHESGARGLRSQTARAALGFAETRDQSDLPRVRWSRLAGIRQLATTVARSARSSNARGAAYG